VVKFDSNLVEVESWGAGGEAEPGGDPFVLFGPRDVTLTNEGNVMITDTGNHRVIEYTQEGDFVRQFGGEGFSGAPLEFAEPVGIAVNDAGDIYIADYFNKRIVVLTSALEEKQIIPMPDWGSRGVTDRPYLALLDDGRLLVTVPNPCPSAPTGEATGEVSCPPVTGTVLVFDAAGTQVGSFTMPTEGAEAFARPIGVATDGESVFVADSQGAVVRKIPLAEVVGP
jgi:DNA-binding beta-propeller fold protein YncE